MPTNPNQPKEAGQNKKIFSTAPINAVRNDALLDFWSLGHFLTGILLGWVMAPLLAIVLMVAWEPLEILVLSPILARYGISFGYESLKNSLSDIVVDSAGVILGAWLLTGLFAPPFHLF